MIIYTQAYVSVVTFSKKLIYINLNQIIDNDIRFLIALISYYYFTLYCAFLIILIIIVIII